MANETVEIIRIEFQADEAIKNTAKLREERDKLLAANKEVIKSEGKNSEAALKNAAQIKVLNDTIREQEKVSQNIIKANNLQTRSNQELKASLSLKTAELNRLGAAEKQSSATAQALAQEVLDLTNELKANESAVGNNFRNVGNYQAAIEGAAVSIFDLKQRLSELQQTIQTSPIDSQQFKDASDEAANLGLQIGQLEGKLDEFGNREPKNPAKRAFEDTIATAGALTSAIQITTLAFDENDGVSQKLAQGVQAIAIAQNVANIVKEKGAIIDTLTLKNFRSLTGVQAAYGVVVGTSTGALKLFRLALAATGIGALIVGLGLLIANFDKVKNSVLSLVAPITDFFGLTSEAGRAQEKLAQDAEKSANAQVKAADELKVSSDNRVKAIDREIALAQASGKSTVELEKKKQREIILTTNSQLQANRALFNALKLKAQNVELTDEEKKKYEELRKTINDQTQAILDASNNINVITANANKEQDDKRKEANDKAIERQKEYQAKLKELNEKFILTERERLIKSFDDELKAITGNGQKEIELRAAISKAKQDAVTKFDNDAKAKEAARIRANELELLQIEQDSLENRLKTFELGFVDREAKLREQGFKEADITRIKNDGIKKIEEQFAKEQLDIQIKSINDLAALNSTLQENELAAVDLSVATEQEKAVKKAEINLKYLQEQLKNVEALANADGQLTAQELANIEKVRLAITGAQQGIVDAQTTNPPKTIGELFGATPEEAQKIDDAIAFSIDSLNNVVGIINERYQREIDLINQVRDAEIEAVENSTLSEEEKKTKVEQINKKAAQDAYQLQLKQFNAEKALNITTAIINTAQAVIKAAAQFGPIGAAIGAAIGVAQIALIASQQPPPPPKFATGVVGLNGPGNETSDSIPAYLSRGESVITARGTRFAQANYPGLLEFLNTRNKFADGVVNFSNSPVPSAIPNVGEQVRAALQDLTIVTKVTDIEKSISDRQSVRNVGVI